jgi:hypothetical protein
MKPPWHAGGAQFVHACQLRDKALADLVLALDPPFRSSR